MEEQIKLFLSIGYGDGYGDGHGSGSGDGDGSGYGDGDGSGYGDGDGSGYGDGSGHGSGDGDGHGSGSGYGDGSGHGSGYGYGSGHGSGYDDGSGHGSGYGYGYGVKMINGDNIYMIDDTPTIIKHVRGNVVKGFILQSDLTLTPTVIVKQNNMFAHGETLHEAYNSIMGKLYDDSSEEERIDAFNKQFHDKNKKYPAKELFHWHHVLTGSCKQGRLLFCKDKGIDIDNDSYTIDEFIALTENSYGGDIIKKLKL